MKHGNTLKKTKFVAPKKSEKNIKAFKGIVPIIHGTKIYQ